MSPEMTSITVQVRVRPAMPASTGPASDTSVTTSRESAGTVWRGVYMAIILLGIQHVDHLPSTCISTVCVYIVSPATATHVNCCSCKSSVTREMVYSSTMLSVVLASTSYAWFLHSIEVTCMLVIHVMVADWPTVSGSSRPDNVIPV